MSVNDKAWIEDVINFELNRRPTKIVLNMEGASAFRTFYQMPVSGASYQGIPIILDIHQENIVTLIYD